MDFSFNITKSTRNVCITKYVRLYKLLKRYNGNDPKINRVLPLPQGNHVAKLLKIQYTELKLLCGNLCGRPPARHIQSHNTARLETSVLKGDEGEGVGPLIYYGRYLFNKK